MILLFLLSSFVSGDGISTHVLDMTTGLPGRGMKVEIFNQTIENEWNFLKELLVILLSMIVNQKKNYFKKIIIYFSMVKIIN